jgi:hypothetical protein
MQNPVQSDCGTEKVIEKRVRFARAPAVGSVNKVAHKTVVKNHEREI